MRDFIKITNRIVCRYKFWPNLIHNVQPISFYTSREEKRERLHSHWNSVWVCYWVWDTKYCFIKLCTKAPQINHWFRIQQNVQTIFHAAKPETSTNSKPNEKSFTKISLESYLAFAFSLSLSRCNYTDIENRSGNGANLVTLYKGIVYGTHFLQLNQVFATFSTNRWHLFFCIMCTAKENIMESIFIERKNPSRITSTLNFRD